MSAKLLATLDERREYPFAVGVRLASATELNYTHFNSIEAADLFAFLCETDGSVVTRWVAITEPEYFFSTPVHGWRQVTYFNTDKKGFIE